MTCNCICEKIEFNCGATEPDFTMGKCIYPSAMSMELNIQSRFDCLFYNEGCGGNNETIGIIDCYDRNALLDATVNGTYILNRSSLINADYPNNPGQAESEDFFSYSYFEDLTYYDLNWACLGRCGGCYADGITVQATASRCGTTLQIPGYITALSACGATGYLRISVPLKHTMPSSFPNIPGHPFTNYIVVAREILTYVTYQPILCNGSVTYLFHSVLTGHPEDGFGDGTGVGSWTTIFPPTITLTPVES
jgi:hypothetical protein